jgi:hypothetical protein
VTDRRTLVKIDWMNRFANGLAADTMKILEAQKRMVGAEQTLNLKAGYLSVFVAELVSRVLTEAAKGGSRGAPALAQQDVMDAFADAKDRLQTAVAAGVEAALSNFSGKHLEYYCQIKPVPPAVNKTPC